MYRSFYNIVDPLFRGHPRDQGKCPLNGSWAGFVNNQPTNKMFISFILPPNLLQTLFQESVSNGHPNSFEGNSTHKMICFERDCNICHLAGKRRAPSKRQFRPMSTYIGN